MFRPSWCTLAPLTHATSSTHNYFVLITNVETHSVHHFSFFLVGGRAALCIAMFVSLSELSDFSVGGPKTFPVQVVECLSEPWSSEAHFRNLALPNSCKVERVCASQ